MSKNKVYISVIVLLVIVNAWYWLFLPSYNEDSNSKSRNTLVNISVDDFNLPTNKSLAPTSINRDFFYIAEKKQNLNNSKPKKEIVSIKPIPSPKPKPVIAAKPQATTPAPKLIGIMFHNDAGSALVNFDNKKHILTTNDKIGKRYKLTDIRHNEVSIIDLSTKEEIMLRLAL